MMLQSYDETHAAMAEYAEVFAAKGRGAEESVPFRAPGPAGLAAPRRPRQWPSPCQLAHSPLSTARRP